MLPVAVALTVGSLFAQTKPAMVVQVVNTDDPEAYNAMITKINALVKAKTGLEKVRHVWTGDFAGENSHGIFVVSMFPSAAAEAEFTAKLADDADLAVLLGQLKSMRKLGPSWLYKAVRDDGLYEGGAVFNTIINCSDEGAYAKQLDELKAIFDANGFKDAKLSLWRLAEGRREDTHIVIIAEPTRVRLAELLDAVHDKALLKTWNVGAAKVRTTLANGSYHEITK